MERSARLAFVLVFAVSMAGLADARQQRIRSRTLLATVTDTGNQPLVELAPDDFVIDEGGEPREVLSLHMADYPIVLLLDDTEASARDVDAIRGAAARFISRVGQRAIAVGTLTDPARLVATLDDSRSDVLDRVRRFSAGRPARPLALQAAASAARMVRDTGSPFAAIVIVSAQTISASQATDGEFLTAILESGAAVHVIVNRAQDAAALQDDDVLRAVAEGTRGQYTPIYTAASYAIVLDRLADRLATEMMIDYLVPADAAPTGDVRVGVRIPGARAAGLGVTK